MFGCIAPPRQSRNVMRSCSQDSREFHGDPRFQRPASVDLRQPSYTTRERSSTPPAVLIHNPTHLKMPKMKRLDKWIGNLLNEKGSTSSTSSQQQPPRHLGPSDESTDSWRYSDDVKVRVAPMNQYELEHNNRKPPGFNQQPTRATSVLQSLRDQKEHLEFDERRRGVSTLPSYSSGRPEIYGTIQRGGGGGLTSSGQYDVHGKNDSMNLPALDDMNVVFLQANDEVKRTLLPRNLHSMHQVKMSFVRTFPNVTRSFVEQPHVKIYIQEPTKGALFYELEEPGDIKNKSVLRLREKSQRVTSPISYLSTDQPDYHSETEQDDGRGRMIQMVRPASAMAAPTVPNYLNYLPQTQQKNYDIYSDPYNSDTSSHDSRSVTRSGSATPVIDRESRARMETMERQLAGLSNLVHTALVSKGMSETTQRDMAELRREILSMHPDSARLHPHRESSEEPASSLSESSSISSHTALQLSNFRQKLRETHEELRHLKSSAQVNAQTGNTLLREAGDKIGKILNDRLKKGGVASAPSNIAQVAPQKSIILENSENGGAAIERNQHASRLADLLHSLTNFETNVENVRGSVLSNQKKLRMSEVEEMTEKLTNIGRLAADLKTEFPPIQQSIEERIKQDMERVVREEKFIRDQNVAVDQSLRRCKALANIMVTMKKLAMVQDPTIHRERSRKSSGKSQNSGNLAENSQNFQGSPRLPPKPNSVGQAISQNFSQNSGNSGNLGAIPPPPPPPPPPAVFYAPPATNVVKVAPMVEESPKSPISMLDNVLEEVGEPAPRPPSRYSVADVRMKYSNPPELPDQLRNLIEDVARRASPGPPQDHQMVRADLEQRQERLAEKQRQLRNQFQQLQQLAPMP